MSKDKEIDYSMLGKLLFIKCQVDSYLAAFSRGDDETCKIILDVIIAQFERNIKPKN